jgi:hypothetical protein
MTRHLRLAVPVLMVAIAFVVSLSGIDCKRIPVKLVEGLPRKPGHTHRNTGSTGSIGPLPPVPSRARDAVVGPREYLSLEGQCFSFEHDRYTYELCPFHNVTQRESTARWGGFYGFLGLWGSWKSRDVWLFDSGTDCDQSTRRQVEVRLSCPEDGVSRVLSAAEPAMCKYSLAFATPAVCHHNDEVSPLRRDVCAWMLPQWWWQSDSDWSFYDSNEEEDVEGVDEDGAEDSLGESESESVAVDGDESAQMTVTTGDVAATRMTLLDTVTRLREIVGECEAVRDALSESERRDDVVEVPWSLVERLDAVVTSFSETVGEF